MSRLGHPYKYPSRLNMQFSHFDVVTDMYVIPAKPRLCASNVVPLPCKNLGQIFPIHKIKVLNEYFCEGNNYFWKKTNIYHYTDLAHLKILQNIYLNCSGNMSDQLQRINNTHTHKKKTPSGTDRMFPWICSKPQRFLIYNVILNFLKKSLNMLLITN